MTNDDLPGYSGQHLMAGGLEAIKRRPPFQPEIVDILKCLANKDDADALDPDVARLIDLISQAGVPAPPLLPNRSAAP